MNSKTDKNFSDEEKTLRAYAQWIEITVFVVNGDFEIKDAHLDWGKFHKPGNKNKEIYASQINGTIIKDEDSYTIASCGRENASSGTEGRFSLYDGNTEVFKYYWDCPWSGSNSDRLDVKDKEKYTVNKKGGGSTSGASGNIFITVVKKY
ncbi:aegerolysin family protein [Alcaligenes faecalis]|uniref:aegerolysin family protein n=1 Tax=Alcaligenes faecalis TaxID=511 RepID=UPI000F0BBF79|nr:aegerolysin family protein [Alcaligenes faecalis]AYR19500.1 aegerolysin [Alcaligenes faecalis]